MHSDAKTIRKRRIHSRVVDFFFFLDGEMGTGKRSHALFHLL